MSQQPGAMPSHLRGAVDLSGLKQRPAPAAGAAPAEPAAGAPAARSWVLDGARQGDLQQLVQLSGLGVLQVGLGVGAGRAGNTDEVDQTGDQGVFVDGVKDAALDVGER